MQVFVACGIGSKSGKSEEDTFRKPKPGMWHIMESHFNGGVPIDIDQLFLSLSYLSVVISLPSFDRIMFILTIFSTCHFIISYCLCPDLPWFMSIDAFMWGMQLGEPRITVMLISSLLRYF